MSYKTLSAQEFLQGKYPQMRGEKWNSNENINDNWIAEMMEEYASRQTSTLRKEIEDLTRAYNQCSESHRRSVDSHCIEKELLQKEIEEQREVIKCKNEIIIGRQKQTWLDVYLGGFKWYRKLRKGTWYKHSFTEDAQELTFVAGNTWWARYGKINRYSNVIKTENYNSIK